MNEETERKVSRRGMIKRLGGATLVAWTAPVISTVGVPVSAKQFSHETQICLRVASLSDRLERRTAASSLTVQPSTRATRVPVCVPGRTRVPATRVFSVITRPSILAREGRRTARLGGSARCLAARTQHPWTTSFATRLAGVAITPTLA
jgi:hypothetical protein